MTDPTRHDWMPDSLWVVEGVTNNKHVLTTVGGNLRSTDYFTDRVKAEDKANRLRNKDWITGVNLAEYRLVRNDYKEHISGSG